ncbi:hypothetical protein P3T35_000271 [Kitasatospora sp. GP30]|nr:hypothetical protein [Kitasatospora sp. GP30]
MRAGGGSGDLGRGLVQPCPEMWRRCGDGGGRGGDARSVRVAWVTLLSAGWSGRVVPTVLCGSGRSAPGIRSVCLFGRVRHVARGPDARDGARWGRWCPDVLTRVSRRTPLRVHRLDRDIGSASSPFGRSPLPARHPRGVEQCRILRKPPHQTPPSPQKPWVQPQRPLPRPARRWPLTPGRLRAPPRPLTLRRLRERVSLLVQRCRRRRLPWTTRSLRVRFPRRRRPPVRLAPVTSPWCGSPAKSAG